MASKGISRSITVVMAIVVVVALILILTLLQSSQTGMLESFALDQIGGAFGQ